MKLLTKGTTANWWVYLINIDKGYRGKLVGVAQWVYLKIIDKGYSGKFVGLPEKY